MLIIVLGSFFFLIFRIYTIISLYVTSFPLRQSHFLLLSLSDSRCPTCHHSLRLGIDSPLTDPPHCATSVERYIFMSNTIRVIPAELTFATTESSVILWVANFLSQWTSHRDPCNYRSNSSNNRSDDQGANRPVKNCCMSHSMENPGPIKSVTLVYLCRLSVIHVGLKFSNQSTGLRNADGVSRVFNL